MTTAINCSFSIAQKDEEAVLKLDQFSGHIYIYFSVALHLVLATV